MKTILVSLGLLLGSGAPLAAQLFRPETLHGALWGGMAGAVIGHNDGRHGWEGAAYGAAAGALIGTWVGESRDYGRTQVSIHGRYGADFHRHRPHGDFDDRRHYDRHEWHRPLFRRSHHQYRVPHHYPVSYRYDTAPLVWRRGDYRRSGVLLGGLVGAVIGHNDSRRGWEGAVYGAGAGYLLGTLADRRAARMEQERRWLAIEAATSRSAPSEAAPAPVTIINNYYGDRAPAPMSSANSLFGR